MGLACKVNGHFRGGHNKGVNTMAKRNVQGSKPILVPVADAPTAQVADTATKVQQGKVHAHLAVAIAYASRPAVQGTGDQVQASAKGLPGNVVAILATLATAHKQALAVALGVASASAYGQPALQGFTNGAYAALAASLHLLCGSNYSAGKQAMCRGEVCKLHGVAGAGSKYLYNGVKRGWVGMQLAGKGRTLYGQYKGQATDLVAWAMADAADIGQAIAKVQAHIAPIAD